jgi:hypothetical protein
VKYFLSFFFRRDRKVEVSETKYLTTKQVAERYGVKQITVRVWCEKGVFKNAYKDTSPRGEYWLIPESDLEGFEPQLRRGRPNSTNPSKAALAKRQQRNHEKNK